MLDLQATADIFALSTATHAHWLGGHLLGLALRIVSNSSQSEGGIENVPVARQRRGMHLGRSSPSAGIEAVELLEQAF
jgi:hypothetical protein